MIVRLVRHPTTGNLAPGYYVLSDTKYFSKKLRRMRRRNLGGPYSLLKAKKRLREVEAFKHML